MNALGAAAAVDVGYLQRIERGLRTPSREVVRVLVRALGVGGSEAADLYLAAGHLPAGWEDVGEGDPTLAAVRRLLADERLPAWRRQDARDVIEGVCRRWADVVAYPVPAPVSAVPGVGGDGRGHLGAARGAGR